jgi:hypothetical protein
MATVGKGRSVEGTREFTMPGHLAVGAITGEFYPLSIFVFIGRSTYQGTHFFHFSRLQSFHKFYEYSAVRHFSGSYYASTEPCFHYRFTATLRSENDTLALITNEL